MLGLAAAAAPAAAGPIETEEPDAAALQAALERYVAFGDKASGGSGDIACGAWLEEALSREGYACRRQPFNVPFFEAKQATLSCGDVQATVIPQAPVAATAPQGLSAPLRLANSCDDLAGAIAVVVLPHKRWVSLADPQVAHPLAEAVARRAAAVILVTTGPTGEALALNVSTHRHAVNPPVAILAPRDAPPFVKAAAERATARLTLDGAGGGAATRPAFNLIARLDRKAKHTLILSTPRSGWFGCAAERGSGLAIWLWLGQELARSSPGVNVELLATSGHEYEYLGGEHYLAQAAPTPSSTRLWVHIGASAAARDWHELGPNLMPLPNADSQRVLTATADVLEQTRDAFSGVTGLEATYLADATRAGGELVNVLNAGYRSAIGLYGGHRYFHARGDDLRCVSGALVQPVAAAFHAAIGKALSSLGAST
jgi:hypothetical protein